MKLHLPVALLAAVVSAMAYGADTGVTFDNSNPGHANVTISENAGDLTGYYMYGTYGNNGVGKGIIGAAASVQDTNGNAPIEKFESATITMNGGKLNTLSGYGVQGNAVTGDTTVIMNGGSTNLIVGGTAYTNGANRDTSVYGISPEGWTTSDFTFKSNYGNEDDDTIQKQNINIQVNGGTVGQIRGTHSGHSQVHLYTEDGYLTQLHKSGDQAAIEQYMQSNPLALSGNVNIDVNGGSIIAKNAGASETVAIYGGGGTGYSVDGSVNIAVGGTANIKGDIIAGSSNNYTFVGSTNTVIEGGSIVGNVYGGGDGSEPKSTVEGGKAPTVKNGTTVVLGGGEITGNVYAAGIKDVVNGGTNVVIRDGGTKVTGIISGAGVDSEVNGERLLSIENSGGLNVSWNQFQDFNAVEFTNSEISFGTLSKDFEKVSAEGSHIMGKFEDETIQLNANDSWLEIGGNLTTTEDSIISNTRKPMTVAGNATFNGTTIGNSTINVTDSITIKENSTVTGSTLTGSIAQVSNSSVSGSTINATSISVDGNATVTDSTLTGSEYAVIVGASVSGSSVAAKELVVNTGATVTDSTLTADNNLLIDRATVSGSSASSTYLFVQNGATVTDSTLTADKNVFITNGSTVSGSSVTSTTSSISVTDSTLTNADLYAKEGKVTITNSSYTNASGANYIVGGTVDIKNTSITSTKDTLFIKGDTTITNGDFLLNGGGVYFTEDVKANAESSFVVNKGVLTFGDNADDVVTLNGSAVENNGGTIHAYGKIDANNASISATAGATHFHNVVEATGTSITAQGGAAMHFDDKVVLDGSKVTTLIDSSNSQGVIKFHDDVEATGTVFEVIGGSGLTFEGNVLLNGDNKLIVTPGEKGYYNRNFSFLGDTVTANGNNLIMGGVTMGADTVMTATNGTLTIHANNGSSSSAPTSTLTNLQVGENGKINVSASKGYLKMTGTSSITNLALDGVWGGTISGTVDVAEKVTITDNGTASLDITSTGSLKTSEFASTGGVITNSGKLTVNNSTTLTDTSLTNNKGTTTLKGSVTASGSNVVSQGGTITLSGTVDSTDSTYYAHGGNISFSNEGNTLTANGGSVVVDKGVVRFGGQYNHNGLVTSNGATFEAIKNSYSDNSVMYFHSAVDANDGTVISALGGTMYFERELDVEGTTITAGKSEAGIGGTIYLQDDVIAKDSHFIVNGGSGMNFKGNVELNGGNTLEVQSSNSAFFTFSGEKVTVNGDNTIAGGLTMGKDTVLTAESGVLNIVTDPEIKENGSYNPQTLRLNNLQIAENAAEGTEINVTANRGQLSIGGDSTVNNLSIDRATTELSGNLNVGGMEIHSTRNQYGVSGTVEFKGAEGTETNIGIMKLTAGTDGEMTHSGDGTVNVGRMMSDMPAPTVPESAINYEIKQTGNGTMNFDGWWATGESSIKMSQTGQGNININSIGANLDSMTQSGGGTVTVDSVAAHIGSLDVSEGSTFENLCSVTLNDVAITDATLFNAGSMSMDSLVLDNATLLFAASSLQDCASFIYNGADLTGYGTNNVSAVDMIQNFGIVISGNAADGLLQQWGSEVEFSFTLAQGSELFEKHFAYVLEQNLAEFTITLGDVAELSVGADEIKNLKVEDTENGVVISGIAVIPEPTTATLSLLALAALAARRRRK